MVFRSPSLTHFKSTELPSSTKCSFLLKNLVHSAHVKTDLVEDVRTFSVNLICAVSNEGFTSVLSILVFLHDTLVSFPTRMVT